FALDRVDKIPALGENARIDSSISSLLDAAILSLTRGCDELIIGKRILQHHH
ncbi:MAG: hypothetical protein Q9162_007875, partial [Coniocarpon cinnabarinum]